MGSLPAGEGVGAEPRVNNTEVGLQLRLGKVKVILPQLQLKSLLGKFTTKAGEEVYLAGVKLSLVDNSPGGEGADVEPHPGLGDGVGGNLTQHS